MYFLYLDESGDLGFDFTKQKTSRFFIITVLLVAGSDNHEQLRRVVLRTLKNKLRSSKKLKEDKEGLELKGSSVGRGVKHYFFERVKNLDYALYSLILEKQKIGSYPDEAADALYTRIVKNLFDRTTLLNMAGQWNLVIDKSKNTKGMTDFDRCIRESVCTPGGETLHIAINHHNSQENHMLQAVDLFSWGIFRKYERDDDEFYNEYKDKIRYEELFPP